MTIPKPSIPGKSGGSGSTDSVWRGFSGTGTLACPLAAWRIQAGQARVPVLLNPLLHVVPEVGREARGTITHRNKRTSQSCWDAPNFRLTAPASNPPGLCRCGSAARWSAIPGGSRLPKGFQAFGSVHEWSRLDGLTGAASGGGDRKRGSADIVGQFRD